MHRQINTREGEELVKLKASVDTRTCRYKLVMNKFHREMRWKCLSTRAETVEECWRVHTTRLLLHWRLTVKQDYRSTSLEIRQLRFVIWEVLPVAKSPFIILAGEGCRSEEGHMSLRATPRAVVESFWSDADDRRLKMILSSLLSVLPSYFLTLTDH